MLNILKLSAIACILIGISILNAYGTEKAEISNSVGLTATVTNPPGKLASSWDDAETQIEKASTPEKRQKLLLEAKKKWEKDNYPKKLEKFKKGKTKVIGQSIMGQLDAKGNVVGYSWSVTVYVKTKTKM